MARILLVGGGCRGLALTRTLASEGHAIRAVTRRAQRRGSIQAAGGECWLGDPDRIATLRYALDHVTVLCWLLGTATGSPEGVRALHGSRLEMMLRRTVDTTVRGVVYEAVGTVDATTLAAGRARVHLAHQTHGIPYRFVEADRGDEAAWVDAGAAAVRALLGPR